MPSSIINSDDGVISGTSGLKSSGGDDGNLVFQSKGTETARINTDKQIVAAAGTASLPIYSTTGDLNTGIYFPGADRIGFAEGGAQCGEFDASGNFQFNSGYGSVATAYGCRAWVNFAGNTNTGGNCTIRASGNVSTVADNGSGDYTINFTTAMPDANYATVCNFSFYSGDTSYNVPIAPWAQAQTTSAVRIGGINFGSGANLDSQVVGVAVFR